MTACEVCGGDNFIKEAGFYYCSECQTQSQEMQEQVFETGVDKSFNAVNVSIYTKKHKMGMAQKKKNKEEILWTSWDAFNYIMLGMTREIIELGASNGFRRQVFKLWSYYLQALNTGFISKTKELKPKLGFSLKDRDARILYNCVDEKKKKKRKRKIKDSDSETTISRASSTSRRKAYFRSQYAKNLSASQISNSSFGNETLESLIAESAEGKKPVNMKKYKQKLMSEECKTFLKSKSISIYMDAKRVAKLRLLSILQIALYMTGSEVQVGDLLRFIRDGHLSYSSMTHFFPKEFKLNGNEKASFESPASFVMPKHSSLRLSISTMIPLLDILHLPCPNMLQLVTRYINDLQLPDYFAVYAERLLKHRPMKMRITRSKAPVIPNYEARAMGFVLFMLKLIFGLDDETEVMLSRVAEAINSCCKSHEEQMFVFDKWQEYIECRRTMLTNNYHFMNKLYQQDRHEHQCVDSFIQAWTTQIKDEHFYERLNTKKHLLKSDLKENVHKLVMDVDPSSNNYDSLQFNPSLTPYKSYLAAVKDKYLQQPTSSQLYYPAVLDYEHTKTGIKFITKPNRYIKLLKRNNRKVVKINHCGFLKHQLKYIQLMRLAPINNLSSHIKYSVKTTGRAKVFGSMSDNYVKITERTKEKTLIDNNNDKLILYCGVKNIWCFHYLFNSNIHSAQIDSNNTFYNSVFKKLPTNFQWLISECSVMLMMPVKELYEELIQVEVMMTHDDGVTGRNALDNLVFQKW